MPAPTHPLPNKQVAGLLALWTGPNLLALLGLHLAFQTPLLGILLHTSVLLGALIPFVMLPWAGSKLMRLERTGQVCSALLLASAQWFLLAFYGLSAIGLRTWGCWITWPIARAYLKHIPSLLEALGYSWRLAVLALGCAWLLLLISYLKLLRPLYKQRAAIVDRKYSRREQVALAALALSAIYASQSFLRDRPFWNANEPLEIARTAHRPFISQFPSMNDPARQARETQAVSKYLATNPKPAARRPLVLITVDGLRSDQMGVYGGPRDNTPFLSTLVQQGRMQRLGPMYSTSTWSYPSLIGVLSSKYPGQFTPQPWNIADVLKRFGYRTYCFFSGDHINFGDLRWMLGPSIDVYRDGASERSRYPNDDRLIAEWLLKESWPQDQPVFLFLHLMSVHELGALETEFMRWEKKSIQTSGSKRDHDFAFDRYHDRILQADARLRQVLALLDMNPAFKDALIIITADHGEFLGEFGHTSHGQEPYEAVTRIPLLIVDPLHGVFPVRPLSSLIDIAPTFLEAIGAPIPPNWQGVPLQKQIERNSIVIESTGVFAVVGLFEGHRYKYFRWRKSGAESFFDLDSLQGEEELDLLANHTIPASKRDRAALEELRELASVMLAQ